MRKGASFCRVQSVTTTKGRRRSRKTRDWIQHGTKQTLKHNKTRKRIVELSLSRGRSNITIVMMLMMMELWYR